jgi:hypothetical protein
MVTTVAVVTLFAVVMVKIKTGGNSSSVWTFA